MSKVHPSTSQMPGQPSHPVGFNEQTYYDPFFPSNNSEENLVPLSGDYSSTPQPLQPPSPEHILKSNGSGASDVAEQAQQAQPPHMSLSNGYKSSPSPRSHTDNEDGDDHYDFLSPNQYLSDNGYNASSEHTATPEYEGFYLEDNYGMLDNPNGEHTPSDLTSFQDSLLNQTTNDLDPPNPEHPHRPSVGTATLSSSHLMSPVLTNTSGHTTREGTASPSGQHSRLNNPPVPNMQINTVFQTQHVGQMQQTPTTTESSKAASPDMATAIPKLARAASPAIRVDQYARGDSPARHSQMGHGVKRSRAGSSSSHLAVQLNTDDDEDDEERFDQRNHLDPDARYQIRNIDIPNHRDQEASAQRALKNADVVDWLDRSASGSEAGADLAPEKPRSLGSRRRARSAGAHILSQANLESLKSIPADAHIPGPNVLIDESSVDEESEDDDENASIEDSPIPSPTEGMNDIPGEAKPGVYDELPKQHPLYRAKLWQDSLYDSSDPGVKMQPVSSNDAIQRFEQRAGDIETLSRVATWGTRRMSESDLQSLFRRFTLNSDKGEDQDKKKRDRSSSFLQRLVPKRNQTLKRKESEKTKQADAVRPSLGGHSRTSSGDHRHESLAVPRTTSTGLGRVGSLGKRPRSPRINTGSAVAAMASPMAALGGGGPLSATASSPPPGPWGAARNVMKRSRSRSDLNSTSPGPPGATDLGIADLLRNQGGPPMPTLVAPKTEDSAQMAEFDDEDDEDAMDDPGVKMDLSIKPDAIIPTLDGFKANIRQLNPRLPSFMFDRIAQEQLRRFKKLMDFKCKHVQALNVGKCPSGKHCTELGGEPTYLPTKATRESELAHAGFSVSGISHSDDDANALAEGIVTPAQFPPGVPMPPVKRLPAEFECSLCYKVKKFQKPSDWSKHVHEDVQPFTCTFATCAEPKSFKRKADWVRHENERHRQLEWWQCNINDCTHRCYRKDNFVQHLVREHKLPEPKIKTMKAGKPAVRGPSAHKVRSSKTSENGDESHDEVDQVWRLVEECRRETPKNPKDETCKFCGNVCNSWKKLTVHLAKHMEQISMPVLSVVRQMDVTPDTIISPIEQNRITSQTTSMSPLSQNGPQSPYGIPKAKMADMPGGFTTLPSQPGYFPDSQYSRVSPHTYPPPNHQQQLAVAYAQSRGVSPHLVSEYNQYSSSPTPPFTSVNNGRAYSAQPSSTEDVYAMRAPTSQPRPSPYQNGGGFQYVPHQQQQQAFAASPIEGSAYQFGPTTSAPYQQNTSAVGYTQQAAMGTPDPNYQQQRQMQMGEMGYGVSQMQDYSGMDGGVSGYGQPGHAAFAYRQ